MRWTWDLQAAQQQVCHTIRNKKHRVPNEAAQANIWQQQLRGVILQLGIRALKVWERQQHNTTRPNQNFSPDERDIRPTATTPALECRSNTNIRRGTWNNHGIFESHHSPQQATSANWDIQRLNTRPRRRTGTYGHWSCQQRIQRKVQQRKRKEAQQRKRKEQEQQRQRIWLRIQQRQRKDWARNAAQRIQQQRRIHRQRQRQANRKRKRGPNTRMLQMWPTRSHSKRLPCGSTQPQWGCNQHIHWPLARWCNNPMVSTTTVLWRPMVEWWPNTGQRTATATTGTPTNKRAGTASSTTSHSSHFNTAVQQAAASNWATGKHHRRFDDWQWSSNTCLPTMACSNIQNIWTSPRTRPKTHNSNRGRHHSLWLQMGVHEEQQATTDRHTLLCVWRVTTHFVSNKTGITGLQHPA